MSNESNGFRTGANHGYTAALVLSLAKFTGTAIRTGYDGQMLGST